MKREAYETTPNEERTVYKFQSTGSQGTITKIVSFRQVGEKTWNLAFGDQIVGDDFDDSVITNNNDLRRVIQTVTNTVYDFLESHPGNNIIIEGVDQKRKSLYNTIFRRKWDEIRTNFTVFGVAESGIESYIPEKSYLIFVISKKQG